VARAKNKIITIFGSSFPKPGEDEYEFAYQLGKKLGENRFDICNGGFYGTMEASAKGAVAVGSGTIGVTVDSFELKANEFIQTEIKCKSLFERITKLIELGDGYVILSGGTGTLLELSAVWELANKNLIKKKPIAAVKDYWNDMVKLIDERMILEKREKGIIFLSDDVEEIVSYLKINLEK
jgi:uncharacterized protein (TIGR00725 family)